MNSKYHIRYIATIPVEKYEYDTVRQLLPKGTCISDEINEFLRQRRLDLQRDQSLISDKSPVKTNHNSNGNTTTVIEQRQLSLDIFCSTQDKVNYVNSISDSSIAWSIKRNAKLLEELADTRAKNLQSEGK
jgi:hypothetical protein